MSYCRFGWEGSDVYIYEASEGLTCCGCRLLKDGFICQEPEEMISHLAAHRRAGQFVPAHAVEILWADVPGAQRPVRTQPVFTVSSLVMDLVSVETQLLREHIKLSAEDKKGFPLPIGLRRRLKDLKPIILSADRALAGRKKRR